MGWLRSDDPPETPVSSQSAALSARATAPVAVTGRVFDQSGTPIPGALVFATPPAGVRHLPPTVCPGEGANPDPGPPPDEAAAGAVTVADGNGAFHLSLPPGAWAISATATGHFTGPAAGQLLTVPDSGLTGIELRLDRPTVWIAGTVSNIQSRPVTGGTIHARGSGGHWAQTAIDARGTYTLPVTPGVWSVSASPPPGETTWLTTGRTGLTISGDAPTATVNLTVTAAVATLTGMVERSGGEAVTRAHISAGQIVTGTVGAGFVTNGTVVDASGAYTLPLGTGEWVISTMASDPERHLPAVLSLVPVATPGPLTWTITLHPAAHCVTGALTDFAGTPAPHGFVLGLTETDSGVALELGRPAASGVYSLPVPAGQWVLGAADRTNPAVVFVTRTVSLPPDPSGVDFQLRAPYTYLLPLAVRQGSVGW